MVFALLTALGSIWALASPPTASPDEPSHAIHAAAVARGELLGAPLGARQRRDLALGTGGREGGKPSAYRSVTVPGIYDTPNWGCFAFYRYTSADCLGFVGSRRDAAVVTPVVWYPPAYYAVVGLAARPFPAGPGALYVMRFAGVLMMAALLASATASLRRVPNSRWLVLGILVGLTPMTVFLAGSVNPSGIEIVAALALWCSGAVLVRELSGSGAVPSARVVARVGLAGLALALARQSSPIWLVLIVATLGFVATREARRTLIGSRVVRRWALVVAIGVVAQIAWVVVVQPLSVKHSIFPDANPSTSELLRGTIGHGPALYREMIGVFGWLDTPAPFVTVAAWTLALVVLIGTALVVGHRRWVVATLGVLFATWAIPIVLAFVGSSRVAALHWQGRYTLPVAVGIPVLAACSVVDSTTRARLAGSALLPVLGVTLATGQWLALAQNVRRYAVGYDGPVWYFLAPRWSPPGGAALHALVGALVIAATYWWLLGRDRQDDVPSTAVDATV